MVNNSNKSPDQIPQDTGNGTSGGSYEKGGSKEIKCSSPQRAISDTDDMFLLSPTVDEPPAYSPGTTSEVTSHQRPGYLYSDNSNSNSDTPGRTTATTGTNGRQTQLNDLFLTSSRQGNIQGTTRRYPRLPTLLILSVVMMASFTWLAHILLFLFPSIAALSYGSNTVVSSATTSCSCSTPTVDVGDNPNSDPERPSLAEFALQQVLSDSAGVFGLEPTTNNNSTLYPYSGRRKENPTSYQEDNNSSNTKITHPKKKSEYRSNWMSLIPDSTPLSQINIPGTHDSATWNFTQTTADSIRHNADPKNGVLPAEVYRCQRVSLWGALEAGVRFFDLRYGLDPDGVRLVFYHAHALMSELATVDDVLFGFYNWLDNHPTEVVILSFKIEDTGINTTPEDNLKTQYLLFKALTSPAAKQYIHQRHDSLGTLGPARGKIILFRRFDNPFDPSGGGQGKETILPGLHLSPSVWTENSKGFSLVYNKARNLSARIEDYYEPRDLSPPNQSAKANIAAKVGAVGRHLSLAAAAQSFSSSHPLLDKTKNLDRYGGGGSEGDGEEEEEEEEGTLFITFTSAEHSANIPAVTPIIMALGNGTEYTPSGGVNKWLVKEILPVLRGKRVGIVIIDFWDGLELYGGDYYSGGGDVVGAILDL